MEGGESKFVCFFGCWVFLRLKAMAMADDDTTDFEADMWDGEARKDMKDTKDMKIRGARLRAGVLEASDEGTGHQHDDPEPPALMPTSGGRGCKEAAYTTPSSAVFPRRHLSAGERQGRGKSQTSTERILSKRSSVEDP